MVKYFDEDKFRLGNEIGRGGDGYVLEAENVVSKKHCAIKVVCLDDCGKYYFKSEREIMYKLNKYNHKNILRADYFVKKDNGNSKGFIVMEKMDCDLCEYMQQKGHLNEEQARVIIKQVCEAMEFMHSKNIAHLDLKLDNILINVNNKAIKLCDFVRAFDWSKKGRAVDKFVGHRISREYRAPEVANEDQYRADKLDQWSVGIILYYLLLGSFPHDDIYDQYKDYNEEVFVDIHSQYEFLVNQMGISADCFNILCLLLNRESIFRPSFRKILQHHFFQ